MKLGNIVLHDEKLQICISLKLLKKEYTLYWNWLKTCYEKGAVQIVDFRERKFSVI